MSGNRAVVRWVYHKMRNGQPWHIRRVDIFTVRDGKVSREARLCEGLNIALIWSAAAAQMAKDFVAGLPPEFPILFKPEVRLVQKPHSDKTYRDLAIKEVKGVLGRRINSW